MGCGRRDPMQGAEGEKDTERRLCVLKLSGKRTAVSKTSGEISVRGHRRGKSANRVAGNLSGKRTGANLFSVD